MSDITVINDSEQSSLVTNGLAKNGELYLKAAGSTDAGAIVVYDSGSWRTFANEASSGFSNTYSVDFDGTNDYMDVGVISALNSASNVSYSFWYKTSNTFAGLVGGTNSKASAYHWVDGRMFVWALGTSGIHLVASQPSLGSWHHVAHTFNAGTSLLYIDGIYISSVNSSATTASDAGGVVGNPALNFKVGSGFGYYGAIVADEVAIFSSTLSDGGGLSIGDTAGGDIADIYNSGVPADLSSLNPVHWWRMGDNDGGTGTTITDQGSGGNDGTLVNGPTFSTDIPS